MGKSITNMYRYAQISLATNMQYLNHLSVIYDKVMDLLSLKVLQIEIYAISYTHLKISPVRRYEIEQLV